MTDIRFNPNHKVVVLTGAGISAESGIKTFRDNNGLWESHNVYDVATPEGFSSNPRLVWQFYKQRYAQLSQVEPNAGHYALVELEHFLKKNFCLVTQNIDGLHKKAGNTEIIEMHGTLKKVLCSKCNSKYKMSEVNLEEELPRCLSCNGILRPDVVWFGEVPYKLELISRKTMMADFFIVIGTSGVVYPAAHFLILAKQNNAYTIGVNKDLPDNYHFIDEFHKGLSGSILPSLVKKWINHEQS